MILIIPSEAENVISATECTGLVPALSADDADAQQNLTALCAVHPPQKKKRKPKQSK